MGFIKILTDSDLQDPILPTMEKALLRSPEYALPGEHPHLSCKPISLTTPSCERIFRCLSSST